ncbi:FCD domain-containing protein, partial [Acinetobacter baumannii]
MSVKTQVDRYRMLTLPLPGRMPVVIAEHVAILKGVERNRPSEAAAAMERHLDAVLPALADAHSVDPRY